MKTDTLFYPLFQTCPELLFEILGLDPALAAQYTFSSREVKQLAFRLDGLFLPSQTTIPLYQDLRSTPAIAESLAGGVAKRD